ncbi:MAG: response regulator transcription factor, partial [Pyrinomonadaceae bacterium]
PLTSREREILQLLAENKSNKEVAARLGISVRTVETHRRSIMQKLNVSSIVELVHYAIRNGMVEAHSAATFAINGTGVAK